MSVNKNCDGVCLCARVHACMHVCMHVFLYECLYVCVYVLPSSIHCNPTVYENKVHCHCHCSFPALNELLQRVTAVYTSMMISVMSTFTKHTRQSIRLWKFIMLK